MKMVSVQTDVICWKSYVVIQSAIGAEKGKEKKLKEFEN
jgi:hypothetical protein